MPFQGSFQDFSERSVKVLCGHSGVLAIGAKVDSYALSGTGGAVNAKVWR